MSRRQRPSLPRIGLGLITLVLLACQRPPPGPLFEMAPSPEPHRARVYLYRNDPTGSLATVRVELDGRPIGTFSNREYETLELSPGPHRLRVGLRSAAFIAWGWNEQPLRLEPGETVFVRLSVRLSEHAARSTSQAVEIAGRAPGVASENVFIERRGRSVALEELADTTRRQP